jgi:CheY-like chemotaxis protein
VDDDALMRAINQRLLEENGFEVSVAVDGPTALRMIPKFRPDLVLLDVIMPNVNGYRVARMIKMLVTHARIRVPKVILLTGRRMNSIRSQDLLEFSKADRMLFKPYNPVILIATIESVLAGEKPHPTTA